MAKICCLIALLILTGCESASKVDTKEFLRSLDSMQAENTTYFESIIGKQDETLNDVAAIKSQIHTLKAVQAESETGNGIGGDLESDPSPVTDTVVNESRGSSPGSQPVAVPAVELFVCSTASCAPCKRMWRDVDDGKLDGFSLTKVPPFDGMRSYPAIRFADPDSDTGWSVVYGYDEGTRLWLRKKLLGEKDVVAETNNTKTIASDAELVSMHNQLHGGGSWTWPGDLATHLATVHGVSTGGERPVSGSFFPVQGQSAVLNSRSVVRLNPYGSRFIGRQRTSFGQSCPTCPR